MDRQRIFCLSALLIVWLHNAASGQAPVLRGDNGTVERIQQPAPLHVHQTGDAADVRLLPEPFSTTALETGPPSRSDRPEVLAVPAPTAEAPKPPSLTLAEFENMALSANPSVARAAALVRAARGKWVQVGLKPNPTIGYEGQQLGSGGLAEQHGVFVEQEIVRGGKLQLNREVAAYEVARAERELAAQRQRVLTDVRIAYYNVLIAQQQEQLGHELLAIADQSVKLTNELLRAQEVARPDVLQARIESENARMLAFNGRNRRVTAWRTLTTAAGQPDLPLSFLHDDPATDLPQLEFGQVLDRLIGGSPEIAAAIANVQRARWALQRAQVETVPNVTVQGMVNVIDNGIGGKTDANVLFGVPLPLWNKNQGAIMQAQSEVVAAERAVEQTELDVQNRLAPVFERYSNALNQVRRYQETILPVAQESLDLTRKSYGAGEIGFLGLLTAQRTYSQTKLSYLDSLRELRESSAQLEGFLLIGSLQSR
jgi:cobalt-zinc-cadmium efflux system outer membrane protein